MIVGYIYQPKPKEKLLASFDDAHLFLKDKTAVMNEITEIVDNHTNEMNEALKAFKTYQCKCAIKSNDSKEEAWKEFIKNAPSKSYVIVSDYSQITDSTFKLNEFIQDAIKKDIYILDFANAVISDIVFDKAFKYYKRFVIDELAVKVKNNKAKVTAEQVIDLTLSKHTVSEIEKITGLSRSTVFRVRRQYGIKERMYHA